MMEALLLVLGEFLTLLLAGGLMWLFLLLSLTVLLALTLVLLTLGSYLNKIIQKY